MRKLLMKLARSRVGGFLAHIGLTYFHAILPIRIVAITDVAIMLKHPAPMSEDHCIIVPKRRIRDIYVLLSRPTRHEELIRFLERYVDRKDRYVICNAGDRQDVKQLHFHVLKRVGRSESDFLTIEAGDGWRLVEPAHCVIDMSRLTDPTVWKEAIGKGRVRFPKGMSIIWK